ncbi:uncharacterized protein LOC142541400 [Primulina tabacum]|uniref:uncharacterized protein LOC142541400 n=1 Tax=Primulina tabacum TaxID=48773 RepID=UPI003F5933F4
MGNCQAIDNASLVIQHPDGKVDNLYFPVSAQQIMKMNPGHYVAVLLTTITYSSTATAAGSAAANSTDNIPLRVTRIKLLRPTDTLVLGHVYRLVTAQEVMKGLRAKKQGPAEKHGEMVSEKSCSDFEHVIKRTELEMARQVKHKGSRNNYNSRVECSVSKSRAWQPSLKSISEAAN